MLGHLACLEALRARRLITRSFCPREAVALWTNHSLLPGAAVVTAPGSQREAQGLRELITMLYLPSCPC